MAAPRKFDFDEGGDPDAVSAKLFEAIKEKRRKMSQQAVKLVADEKRWLRKKRLANTKLKNIARSKRNLRKRRAAFEKTVPKGLTTR